MYNSTFTAAISVDAVVDKHEIADLARLKINDDLVVYRMVAIPTTIGELAAESESLDEAVVFLKQEDAQQCIATLNQQHEQHALNQPVRVTFLLANGDVHKVTNTFYEFIDTLGSSTILAFNSTTDTFMTSRSMLFRVDQRVGKTALLRRVAQYVKASPQVSKYFNSVFGETQ